MDFLTLLFIALGLAMDAFAVALGTGTTLKTISPRLAFRLSFHFGLFQFLMPITGWLAGQSVERYIADYDHWVAFGLLAFVGGRMIRSAWNDDGEEIRANDPTRGLTLLMLSVATSIDALAVGLSLGLLGISILYPSVVIGIVAALMTILGLRLGRWLGVTFGRQMELVGGIILIAIGLRVLIAHLS